MSLAGDMQSTRPVTAGQPPDPATKANGPVTAGQAAAAQTNGNPVPGGLAKNINFLLSKYSAYNDVFKHVSKLIDIHEGNLLHHLDDVLRAQLSPQSYDQCRHRLAPINLMNKIVEKTAKVYTPPPARRLIGPDGTPAGDGDQKLFQWYIDKLRPNVLFKETAETLTMCKSVLVQPFVNLGRPQTRVVQNDHMFVVSTDTVDPLEPTHVVLFTPMADGGTMFTAYTDDEMLIFNGKGEIQQAALNALDNPEGVNPYDRLPFVYRANSRKSLMPNPDSDMLRMTLLIPLLFSDLNYAAMFQSFCIMYGINVTDENLKMSPNAFWRFKSDNTSDAKPEIGVLKPEANVDAVLNLIQSQLSLWLNSRGIRPGAIGKLDKNSFASGISKMIDEMDTVELRQDLVEVMTDLEQEYWDLVMYTMHPEWYTAGLLDDVAASSFTAGCKVELVFNNQLPLISRGQMVADLDAEHRAGFTTRKRCIKQLNPLMTDDEVDGLEKEVDDEKQLDATTSGGAGGAADNVAKEEEQAALEGSAAAG